MKKPSLRRIPFNALPEVTRERFAAMSSGAPESPAPIHFEAESRRGFYGTLLVVLLAALGYLLVVAAHRFGRASYNPSDESTFIYFLVAPIALAAGVAMVRRYRLDAQTPYRQGTYLLPTTLVVAKDNALEIWPIHKARDITIKHTNGARGYRFSIFKISFVGFKKSFRFTDKQQAVSVARTFDAVRAGIKHAFQTKNAPVLRHQDVFFEAVQQGLFGDPEFPNRPQATQGHCIAPSKRLITPTVAAATLLGGVALGAVLFGARTELSNWVGFRKATESSVPVLQSWLQSPSHAERVRNHYVPRAYLRRARHDGEVRELREYLQHFPNNPAAAESQEFLREHLEAATANLEGDPLPVVTQLHRWALAGNMTNIPIVVFPTEPAQLRAFDEQHQTQGHAVAPTAPHFGSDETQSRHRRITESVRRFLTTVFPEDFFRFSAMFVSDTKSRFPRIEIRHRVLPSGEYFGTGSDGVFAALQFNFDVRIFGPDRQTTDFRFSTRASGAFQVQTHATSPRNRERAVYRSMANQAYDEFGEALLAHLLSREPSVPN